MGCGNSKGAPAQTPRPGESSNSPQTHLHSSPRPPPLKSTPHEKDTNVSRALPQALPPVNKGFVVFDIPVANNNNTTESEIDRILQRPLPPRLRHLQPLENVPRLTAEQLEEKLRKVEEKRSKMLARRRESGQFKSKRVLELQKAKEEEQEQLQMLNDEQIRNKVQSADRNRALRLQEIQEKQRLRELKARQTREKARKIREIDNLVDYEIERYDVTNDNLNTDSDSDSWLNEENNRKKSEKLDSCYDKLSSGYNSRDLSASTQCSFDTTNPVNSGKTEVTMLEVGGDVDDVHDFF